MSEKIETADPRSRLSAPKRVLLEKLLRGKARSVSPSDSIPRREALEHIPLSYAQERLWFLDQLDPGNYIYNVPGSIRLTGPLDISALRKTLNEIVRRHECLRTSFRVKDSQPFQLIADSLVVDLPVIDLSLCSDRESTIDILSFKEARRPFDLAHDPLLRTIIFKVGEDEHVLLLNMHHAVSDGWSVGLLVHEFARLY